MLLDHLNIVKAFSYFRDDNFLCIVMELVEGCTLKKKIDEHSSTNVPFTEAFILDIFIQLVSALKYCKQQNILHRDLKPENILITKEGNVKLIDFGVGRLLDTFHQQASTFAGTIQYIAPEIHNNQPYSFPADVWSLGCVIYQLMMLKQPFETSDLGNLIKIIKKGQYPPLTGNYENILEQIVEKMLIIDFYKRITIEEIYKILSEQFFDIIQVSQKTIFKRRTP
jgi:NIMA (never in mitosis gene a)-related kinase